MYMTQLVFVLICFVYLATQVDLIIKRWIFILIVPMMISLIISLMKAKKIENLSAQGNVEEMKRLYRQGMIYIWVFFMICLIMAFVISYYVLR